MQTLQYDLRDPAAKDNSITHAAAARSNLDAAITLRSAETELQNTIDLHATASEIAAPKPKQKKDDFEALCKRIFGKLLPPKLRKSADKSLSQPGCSHPNTIYNLQLQKTIVLRMQPPHQATLTQPFQCDLQPEIPKHPITTHTQADPKQLQATITLRQEKKANRPQPQPPHRQGTFHRRLQPLYTEKTRFRASASSRKQSPCNIMQPLQCDLKAQVPKHSITMHAQAHPTQLEATVTMRQKKANQPQPQPPHRRGTFHRRLQPLYTEKHKVSCSGFLPKTEPLQHHAAIPMRSATGDSKTPCNYAHTSTPKAA